MQPNQQDPYASQSSTQPASNVPDYLQLNTAPAPQKSTKGKIVLFVIAGVLILGVATAAALLTAQPSPEDRFYTALDNMMQSSYITRKYQITDSVQKTVGTITAESDFSDISKPKSKATYDYTETQGDLIFMDDGKVYNRFAKSPLKDTSLNQWQKFSSDTEGAYNFSVLRFLINSPLYLTVSGNIVEGVRGQLIEYAKSNTPYEIRSVENAQINGNAATLYNVLSSRKKFVEYANKAAVLTGMKSPYETPGNAPQNTDIKIWVDNATNKIVKSVYSSMKDKDKTTYTIEFAYPKGTTVEAPTS